MKLLFKVVIVLMPWRIRRLILVKFFKYEIHPSAKIGLAWIFPEMLIMSMDSRIDHFTVAIHLDCIQMDRGTKIGRGNWITGLTTLKKSIHFNHRSSREAKLCMRESSAITKNHHIDCTDLIEIGRFATIAGYNSQFLTHSIDLVEGRQDCAPILIGDYTFVGTNVVVLGGAILPSFSILGAKSLLNKKQSDECTLYGGVPAKPLSKVNPKSKYFIRGEGFVA